MISLSLEVELQKPPSSNTTSSSQKNTYHNDHLPEHLPGHALILGSKLAVFLQQIGREDLSTAAGLGAVVERSIGGDVLE